MVLAMIVSIDAVMFASVIDQGVEAQEQEQGEIQEPVEPEEVKEPEEVEEEPVEEPEPMDVPEPVEEPKPVEDSKPVEVKKPAEEPKPVKDPKPAKEPEEKVSESSGEEEQEIYAMLDNMPPTEHPNPAAITRFSPGSLGAAGNGVGMMNKTSSSGLEPGEVRTSKTAIPVPGMVNTWDIKVRIEGRDREELETTDVVLVIDRSGSMADNNRMANAKTAANNFINTMIPADPNLRIAIVSFSSQYQGAQLVTVNRNFTRNINQLTSSVNGLNALGGTHTQAGIIQGQSLLTGSGADNKFMVLLSDGQPTYSYEPEDWTVGRPSWGTAGGIGNNSQRTAVYDGNYTGTVVGNGSDLTESYNTGSIFNRIRRHIHNGFAAIRAGQDARSGFEGLFTIAVQAGSQGTPILEQIATPGMAYSTQNPEELQEIYNRIGSEILTQSALRNVTVTDEMGDGFSLISGSLSTSEGATAVAGASGGNNQTITWTINPAVDQLVAGTDDVRFAEMTYRVEINDDILDLPGAKTNEHQLFETNKVTNLSYLDINDTNKQVSIDSPKVDPVLLKIKKVLKDEDGKIVNGDQRKFNVEISKEAPDGFKHTENLVPNEGYVWLTTLRYEGTYDVEENSITGNPNDLSQYEISYKINGDDTESFKVNHINNKPRGDVDIVVTNQLIPQTVDVTIEKEVTGNMAELEREFEFTVIVNGDTENPRAVSISQGNSRTLEDIPKDAELKLFENAEGYDIDIEIIVGNAEVNPNQDGSYAITLAGEDITIKVTNYKDEEIDTGISLDSLPYLLILAGATVGLGVKFVRKRKED